MAGDPQTRGLPQIKYFGLIVMDTEKREVEVLYSMTQKWLKLDGGDMAKKPLLYFNSDGRKNEITISNSSSNNIEQKIRSTYFINSFLLRNSRLIF